MAVFQGGSGLPEDRFINTFHFHSPVPDVPALAAEECRQRVIDFYSANSGTLGIFGRYLSNYISRTYQVVSYSLLLPPGERIPTAETATLPAPLVDEGLPEELAVCLTIRGDLPWTARRRGRIYLGPFVNSPSVMDPASTNAPARVESGVANNITSCILEKASLLSISTAATPWCIRSTVPVENFVQVTSGYVDDAFDIQRRRGPDPTLRNSFAPIT